MQAPANLPPLDLMIVEDGTFDRIENTSNEKMLDGEQIRIPDVLRLVALKLHATAGTDSADERDGLAGRGGSCSNQPTKMLKILNCMTIISQYGGPKALAEIRERTRATAERLEMLNFPSPREPLLEWTQSTSIPP